MAASEIGIIGNNEKRLNFVETAESRINKALKALDFILPITDAEKYMYSDNDRKAIIAALNAKVEDINKAFMNKGPVAEGFTLGK